MMFVASAKNGFCRVGYSGCGTLVYGSMYDMYLVGLVLPPTLGVRRFLGYIIQDYCAKKKVLDREVDQRGKQIG